MSEKITRAMALAYARERCATEDVLLVEGDDFRRLAVSLVMWGVYAIAGVGRSFDDIHRRLPWTLPGARSLSGVLAALELIPVVGVMLRKAAEVFAPDHDAVIFLPPDFDPELLPGVIEHELMHCGFIRAGSLAWCVAYLMLHEFRATEACCYGADAAWEVLALGRDPDEVQRSIDERLRGYALDAAHYRFAQGLLAVHIRTLKRGVDPIGRVAGAVAALRRRGWMPEGEAPPARETTPPPPPVPSPGEAAGTPSVG